jgi:hypothetical protein
LFAFSLATKGAKKKLSKKKRRYRGAAPLPAKPLFEKRGLDHQKLFGGVAMGCSESFF